MIQMRTGNINTMPRSNLLVLAAWLILIAAVSAPAHAAERFAVFRSTDRGRSWTRFDEGMPGDTRINAFEALDDTLFAGTDSGIFISRDEGRSWQPATRAAMTAGRILCFATMNGNVYAGTDGGGLLVSADQGMSWGRNVSFPAGKVRCLLVHEGKLHAGTDADGVLVSSDRGQNWTRLRRGFPDDAQVFALSAVNQKVFVGLYGIGLHAWDEQLLRWTKQGGVSPLVLAVSGGTLVAGHNPGGIHWSEDLGASWFPGRAAAPAEFELSLSDSSGELTSDAPVWAIAAGDDLTFAGASDGIYYSEDRGHTWVRARQGLPDKSPGVSFLVRGNLVLAGTVIPE